MIMDGAEINEQFARVNAELVALLLYAWADQAAAERQRKAILLSKLRRRK